MPWLVSLPQETNYTRGIRRTEHYRINIARLDSKADALNGLNRAPTRAKGHAQVIDLHNGAIHLPARHPVHCTRSLGLNRASNSLVKNTNETCNITIAAIGEKRYSMLLVV